MHREVCFPNDEYISSLGVGETNQSSREDAISQLVLYFNSKITVDSTSSLSIRETDDFIDTERSVSSEVSILSETELPTLSFTESYFHEQSGKWYVCAYIDKDEAIKVCLSKAKTGIKDIESKLKTKQKQSKFSQFINLSKTLKTLETLEKTAKVLTVLDFSNGEKMYSKIISLKNECDEKGALLKEQMKFSIKIENDFDDGISIALQEILEREGFIYEAEGNLCIKGFFKTSMTENSAGIFVTPRISLQIIDIKSGGKTLASYSKTYKRWGHINVEGAMKKALFETQKDLKLHFMEIFR